MTTDVINDVRTLCDNVLLNDFDAERRKVALRLVKHICGTVLPHPAVVSEALDLARRGKKIAAIKLVRTDTGCGLKDAKDFVEAML